MNVYFLVEGLRTEMAIYPSWIASLCPNLHRVEKVFAATRDSFFIFSGEGYPSILDNHLRAAVDDVNRSGKYDYLVIVIDADELSVADRVDEIRTFVREEGIEMVPSCTLEIVVQNRCIETWLLGNRQVVRQNPTSSDLLEFKNFYDVRVADPEAMPCRTGFDLHAACHLKYLKTAFAERNITYSKRSPGNAATATYIQALKRRASSTGHLQSLQAFLSFCARVSDGEGSA